MAACWLAKAPQPAVNHFRTRPGLLERHGALIQKQQMNPKAALALGLLQVTLPFMMNGAAELSINYPARGCDLHRRRGTLPRRRFPLLVWFPKRGSCTSEHPPTGGQGAGQLCPPRTHLARPPSPPSPPLLPRGWTPKDSSPGAWGSTSPPDP